MSAFVITGASSGLGREVARLALQQGPVVLNGRDRARLDETVAPLAGWADHFPVSMVYGDLRLEDTRYRMVNRAAEVPGYMVVILSAAAYLTGRLEDYSSGQIASVLETNVLATIQFVQFLYRDVLKPRGGATIVNVNSVAGRNSAPLEAIYAASKHAMAGFFKSLRVEAGPDFQIVDVHLGAMNTGMLSHRTDLADCIDPGEAAEFIMSIADRRHSLNVDEVYLSRRLRSRPTELPLNTVSGSTWQTPPERI